MAIDDDKTIIISTSESRNIETHVINMEKAPDIAQQNINSLSKKSYDIPFVSNSQNQPFLYMLRDLYREITDIENGYNKDDETVTRNRFIRVIDDHTRGLSEQGYENTHIMIVRYIISTFIDESLGSVQWKGMDSWANHSLLGYYYKETYGGKKFFQLLDKFAKEPTKYLQHMKLIYVCLSLGYKGQYSLTEHGNLQIENIRQELFTRIQQFDVREEKFYHNHPASTTKNKLTLQVPYKIVLISGIAIIAIIYGILTNSIMQSEKELIESLKKNISLDIRREDHVDK